MDAQCLRLAPDMAIMRLREVIARCDEADAGSPELLAEWRQACRAVADTGADINATSRSGRNVAHIPATCTGSRKFRVAADRAGGGMDLAAADEDGITPLYTAVLNANPAVTDAALVGTNSDMFSANGHTPLH